MSDQTTTETAFPTPARDRYDAKREEFTRAEQTVKEIERTRLAAMSKAEVVALADVPKSTSKADAITVLADVAWRLSSAAAEQETVRSEASREAKVYDYIERAKPAVERALDALHKEVDATFPQPMHIMDAAERLAVEQTMARHWAQVKNAILTGGLEPLKAVETVAQGVVSDTLETARFGSHNSTAATHNLTKAAEQRGRATWLNDASRMVPSIPNSRW